MLRIIREFFNPARKCLRLPHVLKRRVIRIRKSSSEWREIVADYKASILECSRCGHQQNLVIGNKIEGYSGCEMPNSMWQEMRDKGYLIMD